MIVHIAPEIKKKFPHVKLGIVTVCGANNRKEDKKIFVYQRSNPVKVYRYEISALLIAGYEILGSEKTLTLISSHFWFSIYMRTVC